MGIAPSICARRPAALLTNWSRGGAALAHRQSPSSWPKNLFLSRDKQLGRKLQELTITFLLESALGKDRILEIYLNIIEWGPELRGLRPAAPQLFRSRTPGADAGRDGAFWSRSSPGRSTHQSLFAHGTPGPGLRSLIDELLAKLRSVDCRSAKRNIGERWANPSSSPAALSSPDDRWRTGSGRERIDKVPF